MPAAVIMYMLRLSYSVKMCMALTDSVIGCDIMSHPWPIVGGSQYMACHLFIRQRPVVMRAQALDEHEAMIIISISKQK